MATYQEQSAGFVKSIFDFSFQHYVTPKLVKVFYGMAMVVVAINFLLFVLFAFNLNAALGVVFLILSPVFFIIYIAFIRMFYEVFMAIFSIAENTRRMVAQGQSFDGQAPPPYTQAAQGGWTPPSATGPLVDPP